MIQERLKIPVILERGRLGQFDVMVNGEQIASRKGGLIAKLTNRPFPDQEELIAAVDARIRQ